MSVPRTRRYPRRPIVKARSKFSDRLRLRIEPSSAWVEGELALLKAIKRKLDEPVAPPLLDAGDPYGRREAE